MEMNRKYVYMYGTVLPRTCSATLMSKDLSCTLLQTLLSQDKACIVARKASAWKGLVLQPVASTMIVKFMRRALMRSGNLYYDTATLGGL